MDMSNSVGELIVDVGRRGAPRKDVDETALTIAGGRANAIKCRVKDISDDGARILLDDRDCLVPKRLKLYIADRHMIAECEQFWRKEGLIGLKFQSIVNVG